VIEGVLFDLDGTLFDHRGAAEEAVRQVADRFRPVIGRDELLGAWFTSEAQHMAEYLGGECSFVEQRRRRVRDVTPLLGLDMSSSGTEVDEWFATNYLRSYEGAWRCFPDALETLGLLRSGQQALVTGVVTNGDPTQQRLKVSRTGLLHLVGPVMTPGDLGFAKPDPSSFRMACRRLGVKPGRTIFVGDSLTTDAHGASRAGLIGVWLDRGPRGAASGAMNDEGQDPPVTRITDLTQLPHLVRSLSV
jgi:putative hydrolase of the HAD superfamily